MTFDNFNRTVAGSWGTASSGAAYRVYSDCGDTSLSVDGQVGHIASGFGLSCRTDTLGNPRPWENASWVLSARFKTPGSLNGSRFWMDLITQDGRILPGLPTEMWVRLNLAAPSGSLSIGAQSGWSDTEPMTWQADTWYMLKWLHAWGNQSRAKVWLASDVEPPGWQVARNAASDLYQLPTNRSFNVGHSPVTFGFEPTTTVLVDDLSFAEAPVLPLVPPPPGTDRNRPDPNSAEGGDPVNTLTGSFGYDHTDVSISGRGPAINFARAYNSNDTRSSTLGPGLDPLLQHPARHT